MNITEPSKNLAREAIGSSRETAREEFMGLFVEAMTKLFLATGERSPAIYKLAPAAPDTRDALQPNQ